ncbi:MAG: flavin-containing monooxygenase, partial [Phyllobacterium sp.]
MDFCSNQSDQHYDAIIVGAGFAGLYMLYRLRALGLRVKVYEAAGNIGGVWYWNRYPGARCDVESMQYSYSFSEELQQEWEWSERFATQPEILSYIHHVADRFALRPHIELKTFVRTVKYDALSESWLVEKETGERSSAKFCIMATGCLSVAKQPDIPGIRDFKGDSYFTSTWPHRQVSFKRKRVGVVGTGSTAIQAIPIIAEQADELWVFQRTASYSVPARNAPLTEDQRKAWKERYAELREEARHTHSGTLHDFGQKSVFEVSQEEREREFEARWQSGGPGFTRAFNDISK